MRKILSKHKAFFAFGIPALSAALLAGCNLYSFIDKPKGDEQILSAARACFDGAAGRGGSEPLPAGRVARGRRG